jgi:hypothetical protein
VPPDPSADDQAGCVPPRAFRAAPPVSGKGQPRDELAKVIDEKTEKAVDVVGDDQLFRNGFSTMAGAAGMRIPPCIRHACPLHAKRLGCASMALSKQDQAFYEEKLGYRTIYFLFGWTCLTGAILFPAVTYVQVGDTKTFTTNVACDLAIEGLLLGSVVAAVLYLAFKFLLSMGWLPARH